MPARTAAGVSHQRGGVERRATSRRASPSTEHARQAFDTARQESRRARVPMESLFPPSAQHRRRRVVIDDDDDDEVEIEDEDYEDDSFEERREPREEFDEEFDEDLEDLDEDEARRARRSTDRATGEQDEQDEHEADARGNEADGEEEVVDGLGEDPSLKRLLAANLQASLRQEKAQEKTNKMLELLVLGGGSGGGRRTTPSPAAAARDAPRRGRPPPARQDRPDALPLDGSTRLFGPGYRALVVAQVAPAWFRRVGAQFLVLPYNMAAPLAMRAGNLDPTDPVERKAFDLQYKGETSRTASKLKNQMANMFFEQLMTLKQLPAVLDAGSPNPPNLPLHRAAFKSMREPPAGLAATDPRFKHCASWLASMEQSTNELVVLEEPTVRKLFETDFFARCQAKGLLPASSHRWNLGALAYFILFTQQRLTIKTGAGGTETYGNLKDGADAMHEVENICAWLMDPIACPTTWPVLLTIRQQNPMYGNGTAAAVM